MLRLPTSLFQNVCLYTRPKDVFVMKGVCTDFREECSRRSLWFNLARTNHEIAFAMCNGDYESFLKDVSKSPIPSFLRSPESRVSLEDLDFLFTLSTGEENFSLQWRKESFPSLLDNPPICQLMEKLVQENPAYDLGNVDARLYVAKRGEKKKYKLFQLPTPEIDRCFDNTDLDVSFEIDFEYSDYRRNGISIEFQRHEGLWSFAFYAIIESKWTHWFRPYTVGVLEISQDFELYLTQMLHF